MVFFSGIDLVSRQKSKLQTIKKNHSGQVVVEYVLLLSVAVVMATIIVSQIVQRDPDNPGFLVKKWAEILTTIGSDDPGKY